MPTNPDSLDVVQVLKRETAALGGDAADEAPWDAPIEPIEDMPEVAGVAFVESGDTRPIKTRTIWPDGNDLRFRDITNPGTAGGGYTLSELLAGSGGLTEAQHKTLRQGIHFLETGGPAEGFASGAYREVTGTVFPSAVVWWESSSKLKKIVERLLTWTGVNLTTDQWKVYDTDGSTVLATITDAISYSGVFETSRTRTIA